VAVVVIVTSILFRKSNNCTLVLAVLRLVQIKRFLDMM
jgi:hypothetical protein